MRKKLYFGHPINVYNTEFERILLRYLLSWFPDWEIVNPGEMHHIEMCERLKEQGANVMDYFYNEVLPSCDGGIFLPFENGKWGAGVFGEAKWFQDRNLPIWVIKINSRAERIYTLPEEWKLSIEETRARIRYKDGKTRPYF